jgi:ankyrin repeat protein
LIKCAARGTYPEAKRLLNLGAKADALMDVPGETGSRSALGNAIYRGHYQLVKLFLDYGADPDCNDKLTHRPLTEAISTDDERMVQLLLDGGADPNAEITEWNGKPPRAPDAPNCKT